MDANIQTTALAGEFDASQTCKKLPRGGVTAGIIDWASDEVFAVGSEVAAILVRNTTAVVTEIVLRSRMCLRECQSSILLPVQVLSAGNHGCLNDRSVNFRVGKAQVYTHHASAGEDSCVVGECAADVARNSRAISGGMTSDPEVKASSLDGHTVELSTCGCESEHSHGFLGFLLEDVFVAAVRHQ